MSRFVTANLFGGNVGPPQPKFLTRGTALRIVSALAHYFQQWWTVGVRIT